MTQVPLVFHVGLGKLGLGFVIPLLAGRASVVGCHRQLAGDATEEKKRLYETLGASRRYARIDTQTGEREGFELIDVVAYGDEGLLAAAERHGPPRIVTCAVGKGISDMPKLLSDLVGHYRDHYERSPLLFIPFENARNAGGDVLAAVRDRSARKDDALFAVDTVVDKVCSELEAAADGCFVKAETASQLVIGIPGGIDAGGVRGALKAVGLHDRIATRETFEYEVRKKAWIVNGLHYCIAMTVVERNLGYATIAEALGDPDVADAALLYVKEASLALKLYAAEHGLAFGEDDLLEFIESVLARMRTLPDEIGRIFRPLMLLRNLLVSIHAGLAGARGPVQFGDILRKWTERIGEPSEFVLMRHRELQEPLVAPRLSLFLLQWLSEYLAWLPVQRQDKAAPSGS